ncbi:MAG: J domain-containing protein [Verrucomicrobiales bacterium]|nr:J domain-containing protein [Verrucomicrobiales bacterium]
MWVKYRDYYEILEVERDASTDQIRKAYRKLARKYHPDVAEDKETAEERFREISEAYEVLIDGEKRQTYDALGPGWEHGSDFEPPPGGPESPFTPEFGEAAEEAGRYHFDGSTGFSEFFESVFSSRLSGAGDAVEAFPGIRRDRGRSDRPVKGHDIEADLLVPLDEVMQGAERQIRLRRPMGAGVTKDTSVKIAIPRGVTEGTLIRCPGLGAPGHKGGQPGDLFFRVKFERHPDFEVDGANLNMEIAIAPWDSVLGRSVPIRTLHGMLGLKIPVGTQPGARLRVKGKGLPQDTDEHGDLYILVSVKLPTEISREERRHWEALADLKGGAA